MEKERVAEHFSMLYTNAFIERSYKVYIKDYNKDDFKDI